MNSIVTEATASHNLRRINMLKDYYNMGTAKFVADYDGIIQFMYDRVRMLSRNEFRSVENILLKNSRISRMSYAELITAKKYLLSLASNFSLKINLIVLSVDPDNIDRAAILNQVQAAVALDDLVSTLLFRINLQLSASDARASIEGTGA